MSAVVRVPGSMMPSVRTTGAAHSRSPSLSVARGAAARSIREASATVTGSRISKTSDRHKSASGVPAAT